MTDLWYYGEGGQQRGPIPLSDLLPLLSRTADPRHVLVWRTGFDSWKRVEDVQEIAQQLFPPPPLRPTAVVREPAVAAEDAAEFKDVKPELWGIGGWLGLVALGQVLGILRLIASVGMYIQSITDDVWKRFPIAIWGEMAMNALLIGLCISTTVLLFKHSRRFPAFFIAQMICAALLPILHILWVCITFSISLDRPMSDFFKVDARQAGQMLQADVRHRRARDQCAHRANLAARARVRTPPPPSPPQVAFPRRN